MAGRVQWNGDQFIRQVNRVMTKRLDAAAIIVQDHAKELISVDGTTKGGGGRDKKGRFLKNLKYNTNPSKPGEPPHVQYGHLRRNVNRMVDSSAMVSRVGVPGKIEQNGENIGKVARWLELGTRFMAARPWLRRALQEKRAQIKAILTAPLK